MKNEILPQKRKYNHINSNSCFICEQYVYTNENYYANNNKYYYDNEHYHCDNCNNTFYDCEDSEYLNILERDICCRNCGLCIRDSKTLCKCSN